MNKIFLQLEINRVTDREEVTDKSDLTYAMDTLWTRSKKRTGYSCWIDLVREDGEPLTGEERDEFFERYKSSTDLEMALGSCYLDASIELENRIFADDEKRNIDLAIANLEIPSFIRVHNDGNQVTLCCEDIRFTSRPNRHLSKFHQYELIDGDAIDASEHLLDFVNIYVRDVANAIRPIVCKGEDDELEVREMTEEMFDIYRQHSQGDYSIVNLANLEYDNISFFQP